jgi:hypothetical protein
MDTLLLENILPKDIYLHFEMKSLTEHSHGFEMKLEEYAELVPFDMSDIPSVVLDGFCNPLELLHFSIKDKPLYLKLYRRRWKSSGSNIHFSNHYDLHPVGAKITHEFASFLKGEAGLSADEYLRFCTNIKP